jgi:hypothetical protein
MRVVDAIAAQAGGNPKLHDVGLLAVGILENGFIDSPKWDENLNFGRGGIVYGNGRLEAVSLLEQMHRLGQQLDGKPVPRPRGVATERETGAWVVQIAFGINAETTAQAQRLLIDHNNLTMSGGGFTAVDVSRMYKPAEYKAILSSIEGDLGATADDRLLEDGQITLTVGSDDYALLCGLWDADSPLDLGASLSQVEADQATDRQPGDDPGGFKMVALTLKYNSEHHAEVEQLVEQLMQRLDAVTPADCVLRALRQVAQSYATPQEIA